MSEYNPGGHPQHLKSHIKGGLYEFYDKDNGIAGVV